MVGRPSFVSIWDGFLALCYLSCREGTNVKLVAHIINMETSPQATMALYYYPLKEIRSRFGRENTTLLKNTDKSPNSSELHLLVGTTSHNNILLWRIWMDRHLRAVFVAASTPHLLGKTPLKKCKTWQNTRKTTPSQEELGNTRYTHTLQIKEATNYGPPSAVDGKEQPDWLRPGCPVKKGQATAVFFLHIEVACSPVSVCHVFWIQVWWISMRFKAKTLP